MLFMVSCDHNKSSVPPISVQLNASLQDVELDSSTTLTWTSSNASQCTASGEWSGAKSLSGSEEVVVEKVGANFYNLNCNVGDSRPQLASAQVTVNATSYLRGTCVDGYIRGSTAFLDTNNNFVHDDLEPDSVTDNDGAFKYVNSGGLAVCSGGFDLDTGNSLEDFVINADEKDKSKYVLISPITSVKYFMDEPSSINAILGVDSGIDTSLDDPVPLINLNPESNFYYEKLNQLSILAISLKNINNHYIEDSVSQTTTTDSFALIAEILEDTFKSTNDIVNIESKDFIANLINQSYLDNDLTINSEIIDDTSTALSYVLPIIQVKEENYATYAIFDFATSTLQSDLSDYLLNPNSSINNEYLVDIIEYIAEDQFVTEKSITPYVFAADDTFDINEDTPKTLNILSNDSFLSYVPYSVSILNLGNGAASVEDNRLLYTPDADFNGFDSLTYELEQGDRTAVGTISIDVKPINDTPVIENDPNIQIPENSTFVVELDVSDVDSTVISYSINGIDSDELSLVDTEIFLKTPADFESKQAYAFTASASDGQDTAQKDFLVQVTNLNDNAPLISSKHFSIEENTLLIGNVDAQDADGDSLIYGVRDTELFSINSIGEISFKTPGDFEESDYFEVLVTVSDGVYESVALDTIGLINLNDNPPIFNETSQINLDEGTRFVKKLNVSDLDGSDLEFTLDSPLFQIVNAEDLYFVDESDYELQPEYSVTITASDGHFSTSHQMTILLNNINDNAPVITATDFIIGEYTKYIGMVTAQDADNDEISFSVSGDEAVISEMGELTLIEDSDYFEKNVFAIPVTVSDSKFSSTVTINVAVTQDYVRGVVVDGYIKESECGYLDQDGGFVKLAESGSDGKFSLPITLIGDATQVTCIGGKDVQTGIGLQDLTLSSHSLLSFSELIIISPIATLASTYDKSGAVDSADLTKVVLGLAEEIDITRYDPVELKQAGVDEALYWEKNNQIALTVLLLQNYIDSFGCASSNTNAFEIYARVADRMYADRADQNGYVDIETEAFILELIREAKKDYADCVDTVELTDRDVFAALMLSKAICLVSIKDFRDYEEAVYAWILSTFTIDFRAFLDGTLSDELLDLYENEPLAPYVAEDQGLANPSILRPDIFAYEDPYFITNANKVIEMWPLVNDDYIRDQSISLSILTFPANGILSGDLTSGTFTYTAASDNYKMDSFTYQIAQGNRLDVGVIAVYNNDILQDITAPIINTSGLLLSIDDGARLLGSLASNEEVSWHISGRDSHYLELTNDSELILTVPADAQVKESYTFTIIAIDLNDNRTSIELTIDVNDRTLPEIDISKILTQIDEGLSLLGLMSANEAVTWSVLQGTEITIDSDGNVALKVIADYESVKSYTFVITATDQAGNLSSTAPITVNINNLNDSAPTIDSPANFNTAENELVVTTINATDADGDILVFSASGTDFVITESGLLSFHAPPDFETKQSYSTVITVNDGVFSASQQMHINIINLNDVAPIITSSFFSVNENQTSIGNVMASDADGDDIIFSVSSNEISITQDGYLSFIAPADFETKALYTVIVNASDGVNISTQDVTISIIDGNDNAPIFSSGSAYTVEENTILIGQIIANVGNDNPITYSISGTEIALSSDGIMSFTEAPDYETKSIYTATVTATNEIYSTSQDITVKITNINDTAPKFDSLNTFTTPENQSAIGEVKVSDPDGDLVDLSISGDELIIDQDGLLNFVTAPDYETTTQFTATISATDGVYTAEQNIIVDVTDVNEPPLISFENLTVLEDEGSAKWAIELSNLYDEAVQIDIQTIDQLAIANLDYEPVNATITFNPGEKSKVIDIKILADDLDEYTESFKISISNPVNGYIEGSDATILIEDSDEQPSAYISSPASMLEGEVSAYLITLANPSGKEISFDYALGAYTPPNDYITLDDFSNLSGSVVIPAGETSTAINLNALEDLLIEPDEIFTINFSNTENITLEFADSLSSINTILINTTYATIALLDIDVDESVGFIRVPVAIDVIPYIDVEVDYQTVPRSAKVNVDYVPTSGTIVFNVGNENQWVDITVIDDGLDEAVEKFDFLLSTPINAILTKNTAVISIFDNDITSILIADQRFDESQDPTIELTLTQADIVPIQVDYELVGVTAVANEDYMPNSGTFVFEPGEISKSLVIDFIDDQVRENDELVNLVLSNPVNVTTPKSTATITILDNEVTEVLKVFPSASFEGEAIKVSLSLPSAQETEASYSYITNAGEASANDDYNEASGTITFAPGETEKTIFIKTIDDDIKESGEFFNLIISNSETGDQVSQIYIRDNDTVNISVLNNSAQEGAGSGLVEFNLSNSASMDVKAEYEVSQRASGRIISSGTVAFAPGATSAFIEIPIVDDKLDEDDEIFDVKIVSSNADYVDTSVASFTVYDNDITPTANVSSVSLIEQDMNVEVAISLTEPSGRSITLRYFTQDGTAENNINYIAESGSFTFNPGDTQKIALVPIIDNSLFEDHVEFTVALADPVNVELGKNGTVTINNNDPAPIINVTTEFSIGESQGVGDLLFSLSKPSKRPISFDYATADVSATSGDYESSNGTVSFPRGTFTAFLQVAITSDSLDENNEIFKLVYSNAVGGELGVSATNIKIKDDDFPPAISLQGTTSVEEGGSISIPVGISEESGLEIQVNYEVHPGSINSADADADYKNIYGTLSFAPGEVSKSINVETIDDGLYEGNELVQIVILEPTNATIENNSAELLILDNDSLPVILSGQTYFNIPENETNITTIIANDNDGDELTYTLSGPDASIFNITNSGDLRLRTPLDFEATTKTLYSVSVEVSDGFNSDSVSVEINLTNVNDEVPAFISANFFKVVENILTIGIVSVTDADSQTSLTYSLSGPDADSLILNPSTGVLSFISAPDFEDKPSYSLLIEVSDGDNAVTQEITIDIVNTNDTAPEFTSLALFMVNDGQTTVGTVKAVDADGDNVAFALTGADFNIDSETGILRFSEIPDYQTQTSYSTIVTAYDGVFTSEQNIQINLVDVGEPVIDSITGVISAGSGNMQSISFVINDGVTLIGTLTSNEEVVWSIQGAANNVYINGSGDLYLNEPANAAEKELYSFRVTATDPNGNSTTVKVLASVLDTTDPIITITGDNPFTLEKGATYEDEGASTNDGSEISSEGLVNSDVVDQYTITYAATDSSGNTSTATRTVNVVDTTAPIISIAGYNPATFEKGSTYEDAGASADDDSEVTSEGTVNTQVVGEYTITYSATDAAGNAATPVIRTVNVTADITVPVITIGGANPQNIELGAAYSELGATASDNIDGSLTVVIDATAVDVDTQGSYEVSYTVSDAAGNAATPVIRTVNVTADITVPVITIGGANPQNIELGAAYSELGATASDNIDGSLTVVIDATAVDVDTQGSYEVSYTVSDAAGNAATPVIRTVNVTADITVPVITIGGANPQNIELGAAYSELGATASDNIDGSLTVVIDATAVDVDTQGSYEVSYTVSDAAGNAATPVIRTVNVTADITVPVITIGGANPQNIELGAAYSELGATASDNIDGSLTVVIDATAVDVDTQGSYEVSYTVSDAAGNAATPVIRTVNVTADITVPVITIGGANPQNIELGAAYSELGATASDNIDGSLTVVIDATAVDVDTQGSYEVSYTVSDAAGNAATPVIRTVNVTADITVPVITIGGANPQNIELGAAYSELGATASDNIDGSLTVVIDATAVDVDTQGSYEVSYTVSDAAGNAATPVIRTVNVTADITVPVITIGGANPQNIELGAAYSELGATASDNIDGSLTVVIDATAVDVDTQGSYEVSYTVSDAAGNAATPVIRTVNVTADITVPVITIGGANPQNIELGAAYSELGATASDNIDGSLTVVIDATAVDVDTQGSYEVSYTVSDAAGNAATPVIRTVNVTADITVPVITIGGANPQNIELGAAYSELGATASDNIDGSLTVVIDATAVDVDTQGSYEVSYTVSDAAGNAATPVIRTVNVTADITVPVITIGGANPQNIELGAAYSELGATASDNIDGSLTVVIDATAVDVDTQGSYEVSYTVSDAAGNAATPVIRTVNVTADITVPVITIGGANPQNIELGAAYSELGATASDNIDGSLTVVIDATAVDVDTQGSYEVSYTVSDAAGNAATPVIRTVNVTADITVPVITIGGANPQNIELGAAYSELGATASDNIDGSLTVVIDATAVDVDTQGSYEVSYTVSDAAGNAATPVIRTVNVTADITVPVITIGGANPQNIELGAAYSELGATASDNIDGSLTVVIDATAVDVDTQGSYEVSYTVSDAAGNAATPVIRTVNVTADITVPVITIGGANPQNIELGAAYSELGATASDNIDGSLTVVIDATAVDVDTQGSYEVSYTVSDAAGNAATPVIRTVNVTADITVPVITIGGANPQNIELGAAYSELGATASDNIDGSLTVVIDATAVDVDTQGSYEVSYTVSDAAGNAATPVIRTVNVTADITVPVITIGGANPQNIELGAAYSELGATASDNIDGSLTVVIDATAVDVDTQGSYEVSYTVSDAAGNAATPVIRTVNVTADITVPVITSGATGTTLAENSGSGQTVYTITASDAVGVDSYAISGTDAALLSVNTSTGVVSLNANPDYETKSSYSFTVTASDAASNTSGATTVTFSITDADEVDPVITTSSVVSSVYEGDTALGSVSADESVTWSISGSGVSISSSGVITLDSAADYDTATSHSFTVTATDATSNSATTSMITVSVVDPSLSCAIFRSSDTWSVNDGETAIGTIVVTIGMGGGNINFTIPSDKQSIFNITNRSNGRSANLTLDNAANYQTESSYSLVVTATHSDSGCATNQILTINVVDTAGPVITTSSVLSSIDEGNTALGSVSADESVTWSISGSGVSINTSGVITLDSAADYEAVTSHSFTVTATDTASNSETTSTLTVTVTDVDDTAPTITSGATGTTLAENSGSGQTVYTITASDAVGVDSYAISGTDAALLSVNTSTGVVSLNANPDYETKSSYSFTVTASDAASNTSGATTVTFSITDADEVDPVITTSSVVSSVYEGDTALGSVSADESVTWSISGSGVSISSSGVITLDSAADYNTATSHSFTVTAMDTASNSATTSTRTVIVEDTTVPVITVTSGTDTVERGSSWTDAGATTTEGSITTSGTVDTDVAATYTITYSATDTSDNTTTATRTVIVEDTTVPVITVTSGTDTVERGSSWTDAGATTTEGSITTSGTVDTDVAATYTITYSATDTSDNTITATRTVIVEDTTVPVITVTSGTDTVERGSSWTDAGATTTEGSITTSGTVDTDVVATYTITYSATDDFR